jgi:hypothetical protein
MVAIALTIMAGHGLAIAPCIQANGGGGNVLVTETNGLALVVKLDTEGQSGLADWWLLANAGADWYYFDATLGRWQPGLQVTYQGYLGDLPATEVLNTSSLAQGTYRMYFGVDLAPDGAVNGELYYDEITVYVVAHASLSDLYIDVYDPQKAYGGLTYFADCHNAPRIVAVDMLGAIAWQYHVPSELSRYTNPGFDVEVLTNGNVLFVLPGKGIYEINSAGTIVWSHLDAQVSHDADRLVNGHTLYVFGNDDQLADAQAREVDANGNLVWSWSASSAFNHEPYRSIYREGWTHANAASRLRNGNTLVNLRNFNFTVEVTPAGVLAWSNDWSTIGGTNCDPHEPEIETNDHLVVCLQNSSPYQVVEIDKATKELVWTYARTGLRTARDCNRLPNGNTLVVGVLQPQEDSVIFEITPDGEIVWQLKIKDSPAINSPGFFYKCQRVVP